MKTLTACLLIVATLASAQPAAQPVGHQSPRIIQTVDPIFPETLIATYRTGGVAHILVSISAEGRLSDWLPTRFTERAFADAAIAALKQWQFEPARENGEPIPVCVELKFFFEVKGVVISITASDTVEATFNAITGGSNTYAPCSLRELDRIPVPRHAVPPSYPEQLLASGLTGEVTVEFFIDEQGEVRMPFVAGRPNHVLANLAVDAVRQWKFEPPTRRGRPVLVHARQLFRFSATTAKRD